MPEPTALCPLAAIAAAVETAESARILRDARAVLVEAGAFVSLSSDRFGRGSRQYCEALDLFDRAATIYREAGGDPLAASFARAVL